ncbi:hypothetical protein Ddye_017500 [Dipteronia dyeriana]|uniref:Uncharacterized protein n=1 Tax=Dipteronia dyeriana TaxID=168575 RepID=A0AAD9X0K8_9ROSI|nr:hypothetical protein Ddye_017500 [Dipteronia dyeriana]
MATQQQPARPWFRLASLAGRPPPQASTTPTPEQPATQPRPPVVVRPPFRPMAQAQSQESGTGVSSVPTSPTRRTSVPNSPVHKSSPTSTTSPVKSQFSDPSSVPTSPVRKPSPFTASVPTSPTKPAPFTAIAAPISPPKPAPAPYSASVTTSPPKPAPYTASVVTTSPPKPAQTTTTFSVPNFQNMMRNNGTAVTSTKRDPSPKLSPRIIRPAVQTPAQSPKQNPTAPPPSPLSLPPPQLRSRTEIEHRIPTEAEPKGVLVQKTIEKPKSWLHGSSEPRKDFEETHHRPGIAHHQEKHEVPKDGDQAKNKKSSHHFKKFSSDSDHEGGGMRIITIAGDNKGAFMEVIKSPLKANSSPHTLHKNGNTKTESVNGTGWHNFRSSNSSSSSGEEGKSKTKDKSGLSGKSMVSPHMGNAFMNSNVQGVNNSIVYNSSCSHHDPGVHLAFSTKPSGHGFRIKDNGHAHDQS